MFSLENETIDERDNGKPSACAIDAESDGCDDPENIFNVRMTDLSLVIAFPVWFYIFPPCKASAVISQSAMHDIYIFGA